MWMSLCAALLMEASEDVTDPTSELAARKYPGRKEDNDHIISRHYWINQLDYTVTHCIIDCIWFYFINTSVISDHTKLSVYSAHTLLTAATTASLTVSSSLNICSLVTRVRVSRPPHWRIRQLVTGERHSRAKPEH